MSKLPGINHLVAVRALEKAGFRIIGQGKHIVMSKRMKFNDYMVEILGKFTDDLEAIK